MGNRRHHKHNRTKRSSKKHLISLAKNIIFTLFYALILVFLIKNINELNQYEFYIIKLGAVLVIVNIYLLYKSIKSLFYKIIKAYKYQNNILKGIMVFVTLIAIFLFVVNLEPIVNFFEDKYEQTDLTEYNPFFLESTNSTKIIDVVSDAEDLIEEIDQPSIEELYYTGNKTVNLNYRLNENSYSVDYTVYDGVYDYISEIPRSISYYAIPPTREDFIFRDLNNDIQNESLQSLVNFIEKTGSNNNEKARIAITLVQNIPYDYDSYYSGDLDGKFPYEVLYTNTGVCGEKSELLIYLLRELGFGTAYLQFENENHAAVGIKCSSEYDYLDSGYCFIESTSPKIITDSNGNYLSAGKLTSTPDIYVMSSGLSLTDVKEDYNDAIRWNELSEISEANDGYLSQSQYNEWVNLVNKYGIDVEVQ